MSIADARPQPVPGFPMPRDPQALVDRARRPIVRTTTSEARFPFPVPKRAAPERRLYLEHCATCHGADGSGSWRATLFLMRPGNLRDPRLMAGTLAAEEREVQDHQRTFEGFARLVLFAALHVALVLAGLALAFLGHAPLMGLLVGGGGTLALIAIFVVTA